ncbi:MAG: 7-carboxy-7-deazaguanine synthase QueE [Bacteroides sp.]|nr:7-carboxy-7-deazaguanine synthase QueE [Bacteroides sp.]
MSYRVNEIFYSIQGEGYFTGTPAVFLRFSGCNLKCSFCDTDHNQYKSMTPAEIIKEMRVYPSRHLIITGGEPSLQLDQLLVDLLHDEGYFIQIETNGTNPLPESVDWVTCSPKGDSSGNCNVKLQSVDELKVVYEGQDVETIASAIPAMHYFLQPCASPRYQGGSNLKDTIAYVLSHPHWRLSLQTHKLIDIR